MRRFHLLPLTCLAAAEICFGATTRPDGLVDLAGGARALPAELAADALLRIAAAPALTDVPGRRELIEDAFHMAAGAQQPFALHRWTGSAGSPFDKAYVQGLDACTLQCRAVHAMLELDYKKARELFESIPVPQPPRLSCDDSLVADVSIFYATAVEVAARAFNPKEAARQEPFHFLERYAASLASPLQAAPIARMLTAASLKDRQFETLVVSFTATLQQLSGDERSFAATAASESDSAAIAALAGECARRRIASQPLLDAWRVYLVRNLQAARCADVRLASLPGGLAPISKDEMKPASVDGKAVVADQCKSAECSRLAAQFSALLVGPNAFALTAEQKSKAEWQAKLQQFLADAADWKDAAGPSECFRFKTHFYSELFHSAPNGPDRDLLLAALLNWLQNNSYQGAHRVEWFYAVNALIVRVFNDPHGTQAIQRALRESTDPVISLYVQLEQVLPRPALQTIGLL